MELALSPVLMGGLGWLLDRWLGTWPVFALALFLFTFCYLVWKFMHDYDKAMRAEQERMLMPRREGRASDVRHERTPRAERTRGTRVSPRVPRSEGLP